MSFFCSMLIPCLNNSFAVRIVNVIFLLHALFGWWFCCQDCFHLFLLPGHQGWPSSRSCEQEEGNLSQNDMMHYAVIRWRAYKDTLWNPMKKFLKKIGPWKSREWAQIALFGPLGTLKVKVCGDHMFNRSKCVVTMHPT